VWVKTTLEIPDSLFRKAKATAAQRGQTLKQFVNEAVRDKIDAKKKQTVPAWERLFGSLKEHAAELRRIDVVVKEEFEQVDPEDWK